MITEIIKKLRKSCGYTQKEVADILGVDRSTYSYYESGRIKPDIDTIRKLSNIFRVHYTQILENEMHTQFSDSKSQVFGLNDEELELLTIFRMLSNESKKEVMDTVSKKIKKKPIKFEK